LVIFAIRDDTLDVRSVTEGDFEYLHTNANGALWIDAVDAFVLDATVTTIFGADTIMGTAGTADADVLTVQGVASMTPLLTNPGTAANWGIFVDEAAFTYTTSSVSALGAVAESTSDALADGLAGALTMTLDRKLYTAQQDPCSRIAKSYYVVDIATAQSAGAGGEVANAVASEFWYICAVNLVTNAANGVIIAGDDTDGCGSLSEGYNGGFAAATEGWMFAANGGIALGNGMGTVIKSTTANRYLCIGQSASTQLSGVITYVSAP
jgi:hypothetical protein